MMRQPRLTNRFLDPDPTHRRARSPLSPPEPRPRWYELLVDLWRNKTRDELARRFAVGRLLNDEIALPDEKQPLCADCLLKAVAKILDVPRADLRRMRQLAARFHSAEAFRAKYPDAVSWADVKRLLRAPPPDSASAGGDTPRNIRLVRPRSDGKSSDPPGKEIPVKMVR
jgi:hypothetical protein